MAAFTVLFDACVLYPAPLRDILMEISEENIFRARWTHEIQEEWISNLLRERPDLNRQSLDRTRELMNGAIPDCLVTGHLALIDGLILPDPDDRHVLAAAIVANADAIVTFNLKDFSPEALEPFGMEAQHPDDFLVHQFDLEHESVCNATRRLRARLKRPPMYAIEYLSCLERQHLPQFVERLRPMIKFI